MIWSYLFSYQLSRPLRWVTPLSFRLDSYPMQPFSISHPLELQYLFLSRSIRYMWQFRYKHNIWFLNHRNIKSMWQNIICMNKTPIQFFILSFLTSFTKFSETVNSSSLPSRLLPNVDISSSFPSRTSVSTSVLKHYIYVANQIKS